MERCLLSEDAGLMRLEGTVLTLLGANPAEIRYRVRCDAHWKTKSCVVHVEMPGSVKTIALGVNDQGSWTQNGVPVSEFDGIVDVDLGFSPSTNTLPIRRLRLGIGQAARISVVWLRFPELDTVRSEQVYTRLAENVYRYDSGAGDFSAELEVDGTDIVTRYGDLWQELRASTGR
jgi:hypothetical protein